MTTAEDGNERRWLVSLAAHVQPFVWFVAAGLDVLEFITGQLYWFTGWFTLLLFVVIFAGFQHTRTLCGRCALNTPTDPQAAVEKDGRWLRAMHWQVDYPLLTLGGLLGLIGLEIFIGKPWANVVSMIVNLALGLQIYSQLKHRVLQPWCPQCRWDDGDDDEAFEPAPPPQIHADR